MPAPSHRQTFERGIQADLDPHAQPAGTYRSAVDLDVVAGNEGNQSILTTRLGTLPAYALPAGYRQLGGITTPRGILIVSRHASSGAGQLGLADCTGDPRQPSSWTYTTLFDDSRDPNGERFSFSPSLPVLGWPTFEGYAQRVWFYQPGGALRCLALHLAWPQATSPVHATAPSGAYPTWLSLHGMAQRMDAVHPLVSFQRRLENAPGQPTHYEEPCNLSSGVYSYYTRYRSRDGHTSPWHSAGQEYFVTPMGMTALDRGATNHHHRVMGAVGVATREGIELVIERIDTRWDKLEVAYRYRTTGAGATEVRLFYSEPLTPSSATRYVRHRTNAGEPLPEFALTQRYATPRTVMAATEFDHRTWMAGLTYDRPLEIPKAPVRLTACVRTTLPDETIQPAFSVTPPPSDPSARPDDDPLTDSTPVLSGNLVRREYIDATANDANRFLPIIGDYANHHGQQISAELASYRGGEVYPIAAQLIARDGSPDFAQPLGTFQAPARASAGGTEWNLTKPEGGRYVLQHIGLTVSGLRLRKDQLRGADGQLAYTGLRILRGPASGRIQHQGILVPTMQVSNHEPYKHHFFPLNTSHNAFTAGYHHLRTLGHPVDISRGYRLRAGDADNTTGADTASMPNYFLYHSPDVLIEEAFEARPSDAVEICSTVHPAAYPLPLKGITSVPDFTYAKLYKTGAEVGNRLNGRPRMGDSSPVRLGLRVANTLVAGDENIKKFDPEAPLLEFNPKPQTLFRLNGQIGDQVDIRKATLQPNAVLLKLPGIESADPTPPSAGAGSFHLVNYVRPMVADGAENAEETTRYYPTGHYLPLSEDLLARLPTVTEGGVEYYELNGVEVFGGDTYVSLFDPARLYPDWEYNGTKRDYAAGLILPIESKYNLALRQGRSLSRNAYLSELMALEPAVNGLNPYRQFLGGIMPRQREEWNVASCLMEDTARRFFAPKPEDVILQSDRPGTWAWSESKVYAEVDDAYRRVLPRNQGEAEGRHGKMTGLAELFGRLYSFQENAYGVARISERAIIPTTTGELVQGSGRQFDGIDYINTGLGLQSPGAVLAMGRALYWVDESKGALVRHSQAGGDKLTAMNGLDAEFRLFTLPYLGGAPERIALGADGENDRLLLTIHTGHGARTWTYGTRIGAFTTTDSAARPTHYLSMGRLLLSVDPLNPGQAWLHHHGAPGNFYGVTSPQVLTFVVRPDVDTPCVFDWLYLNIPPATALQLRTIELQTETAFHSWDPTAPADDRLVFRSGLLRVPARQPLRPDRLRGQHLIVTLTFQPTGPLLKLTSVGTQLRLSLPR